jgi:YVTN family beta-propeller protein
MATSTQRSLFARSALVLALLGGGVSGCRRSHARAHVRPQRAYVSNEDGNSITVLDLATRKPIKTIAVGKRPRGLRLSPDGRFLYVALSGSPKAGPGVDESKLPPRDQRADGIGVVDLQTLAWTRTLESGRDPEAFDVTPDGKTIVVSNEETAQASIVDVASGKVLAAVAVGEEPEGVTIHPDGRTVYVTSESASMVYAIDIPRREVVGSFATGGRPRAVAFSPDGARAFVTCEMGAVVTVADARKHVRLEDVAVGPEGQDPRPRPMGIVVSPDGKTVWVTNGRAKSVVAIDASTLRVVRTVEDVGIRPWGVDLSRDGTLVLVANGPSNDVTVLEAGSGATVTHIEAGASPWGLVAH